MQFRVIDKQTGKIVNCEEIAKKEPWANKLISCDVNDFFLGEDGSMAIADECGNYVFADPERFILQIAVPAGISGGREIYEGDRIGVRDGRDEPYTGIIKFGSYGEFHYGFYVEWERNADMLRQELAYWLQKEDVHLLPAIKREDRCPMPEIGNLIFGNSRGKYPVDRDQLQDVFAAFLDRIGCDGYGYANDKKAKRFENERGGVTIPGFFEILPYYWGEDDEEAAKHNFVYYPDGLEIDWYKYPMRDAYSNKEIRRGYLKDILARCEAVFKRLW